MSNVVFSALTMGQITTVLESRYTGNIARIMSFPLSCQVWSQLPVYSSSMTNIDSSSVEFSCGLSAVIKDATPALFE